MAVQRFAIEDRASWLAMRRANIGASEVAILLGQAQYGSAAQLYAEKKGLRPATAETAAMRRGRWGEAAVFEALAEERPGWRLTRARIYLYDPDLRIGATPDGFALRPDRPGRGIVQAKTAAKNIFSRRWLNGAENLDEASRPPEDYRLQVITEMMLSECDWGVLATLVLTEHDWVLHLDDIERDPIAEAAILGHVAAFWRDHFDPEIMPAFEPQSDAALLQELYPQDFGTTIDLTTNNRALALADELRAAQKTASSAEKLAGAIKVELQALLGEHTYGRLADGRCIQWRTQHRDGYTVQPSSPRVLTVLKSAPASAGDGGAGRGQGHA